MNHLQNKITSTENNFNYQYNNLIRNNQNNSNTNNYYLNNKIDSYKKDIFIEDNDLIKNNDNDKLNNNYGLKEKYINKKYNSNNKYTYLKKSTSFNEPKNYTQKLPMITKILISVLLTFLFFMTNSWRTAQKSFSY